MPLTARANGRIAEIRERIALSAAVGSLLQITCNTAVKIRIFDTWVLDVPAVYVYAVRITKYAGEQPVRNV